MFTTLLMNAPFLEQLYFSKTLNCSVQFKTLKIIFIFLFIEKKTSAQTQHLKIHSLNLPFLIFAHSKTFLLCHCTDFFLISALRSLNEVEKKYLNLQIKHEHLETELFEKNEEFTRLSTASKNLYKEYETLKNQYETETRAMSG